jgi:hypothetical protein
MKKFTPSLLIAAAFLGAVPLSAAPDFTNFNQAVTNYFAALDALAKKVPTVNTAEGTVAAVNEWALANEIFADATDKFVAENPEIRAQAEPPKEFAEVFGRLKRVNTDYPNLPVAIGKLGTQFRDDAGVLQAFLRFRQSLVRLHMSGKLGRKTTPTPTTPAPTQ